MELDLSYNNLTHIEPETFAGNERLQTLTLSHNKMAAITPYVFPLLKHLKSIDLSHNFIESITRNTFENLGNSVESLNLDNNRLNSLREEVFLPLTNLKSLQVSKYLLRSPWETQGREFDPLWTFFLHRFYSGEKNNSYAFKAAHKILTDVFSSVAEVLLL